jgi:hypothetical protein
MEARGRDSDQHIAGGDAAAVDQALARHGTDDEARDVVLAVSVESGHFGGLAAEQRAAVLAARTRETLDDLHRDVGIQPAGREIVEEEQRLGALHEDVVDAVIDEIGADRVVDAAHEREAQLRADTVRARHEHGIVEAAIAKREQAAERSEIRQHAGGMRAARQPLDAANDFVARFDINAGVFIVHSDLPPAGGSGKSET